MTAEPRGELVRVIHVRALPPAPLAITAHDAERAALAKRFGVRGVHALSAQVELIAEARTVRATGHLDAVIEQDCAVSAEPFTTAVAEPIDLLFVPDGGAPRHERADEEIELAADDLDEIGYTGDSFDLGEAIAQTLGLAIDPYAEGPDAPKVRAEVGIAADDMPGGPLAAALSALKLS